MNMRAPVRAVGDKTGSFRMHRPAGVGRAQRIDFPIAFPLPRLRCPLKLYFGTPKNIKNVPLTNNYLIEMMTFSSHRPMASMDVA